MPRLASDQIGDLAAAIDDLYLAMRRSRSVIGQTNRTTVSIAQLALLEPLSDDNAMTVGSLAEAGGIAGPTATRMLKQLERADIVQRCRNSSDERQVLVRLTPQGISIVASARAELRRQQADVLSKFSAPERDTLTGLLMRLTAMINDQAR
jgi:MarR family transcriptional regulator, organic hydroperoxide resistance regulator